ncbi:putative mRNA capping enzyme [Emiliania huxleyi virus 99B1]|nr:hypothetical protein EhVM1_000466 [Emiliania huxleyi virus M1]CAZ69783.1 putative mRNA capping enzyme [Emiliania huxleyi virus 99B1]
MLSDCKTVIHHIDMRYNDILYTGGEILHLSSYPIPNDHGKLVIDEDKKTFLQHRLTQLTGSTSKNGFPIAQPESFKRSVIPTIMNGKFCASLKTDGVRAMLLLTKYNNEFVAVLIDRKLTIREVEVWAPEKYFNDTLFDGEIVTERSDNVPRRDVFLAFDMYVDKGVSLLLEDYTTRITAMNNSILDDDVDAMDVEGAIQEMNKVYVPPAIGISIRAKMIKKSEDTILLWNTRMQVPHLNDGIIFTPDTTVVTSKVYKWKPLNTIDVFVYKGDRTPYIMHYRALTPSVNITLNNKVFELYEVRNNVILDTYFSRFPAENSVIVECGVDIDTHTQRVSFAPIKTREDKTAPNALYVVKETINNVLENVEIREFKKK